MFGLVVIEVMTLSGHLSNINEMLFWPTFIRTPRLLETSEYVITPLFLDYWPIAVPTYTTWTVRNKWEKLEHIGKVIFDIPFMIQSHAESMKKILGAL